MNHTPGPWTVEFNQSMPNQFIVNDSNGMRVAYVAPQPDCLGPLWNRIEAHNAHLIAAAPELLEVLKALLAYEDDRPGPDTRGEEIYQQAEHAITKAEGKG